jgi:hypothetical protein
MVTLLSLFETQKQRLRLERVAGHAGPAHPIKRKGSQEAHFPPVAYLELRLPHPQLLHGRESSSLDTSARHDSWGPRFALAPYVTTGCDASEDLVARQQQGYQDAQ